MIDVAPSNLPTHAELVELAGRWLQNSERCGVVFCDVRMSTLGEQPDAIGWKQDWLSVLVECKASRSDFLRDAKKPYHDLHFYGRERWYLAPAGMLTAKDIPDPWGLLELRHGKVYRTKPAGVVEVQHTREEMRLLLGQFRRYASGSLRPTNVRIAPVSNGKISAVQIEPPPGVVLPDENDAVEEVS